MEGTKKITALLFELSTDTSELAGSVLCIETRNAVNERVLVMRALNPTEAVIRRELSPESFIEQMRAYFIHAAERENEKNPQDPIMEVRMCFDHLGGHPTNRLPVFQAMSKCLNGPWKNMELLEKKQNNGRFISLENVSDTNFNAYAIWVPGATRLVWRKAAMVEAQPSSEVESVAPSTGIVG